MLSLRILSVLGLFLVTTLFASDHEWTLVWSDEFDGEEIDFTKWAVEENANGGGNQELQYYVDKAKNVRVEDGHLIIEAHREPVDITGVVRNYSSGRIRTKRRVSWTYGRFEVRAKLPDAPGLWPAIWMLPETDVYGRWAASGEIDIAEANGKDLGTIFGSLHYGGTWPENVHQNGQTRLAKGEMEGEFHVYALEWEKEEIRWYIDGRLYHKTSEWFSTAAPYPAPFDQPFHLLLNLAVGGNWAGNPNANTQFPAQMKVDYVHVYQKSQ